MMKIIFLILMIISTASAFAAGKGKDAGKAAGCAQCGSDVVRGEAFEAPKMSFADQVMEASEKAVLDSPEFKYFYKCRCTEFKSITEALHIDKILEKIKNSPYKNLMKYFFTLNECESIKNIEKKVPLLQLYTDRINNSREIPDLIQEAFERNNIDLKIFNEAINVKDKNGMTFLDQIFNNVKINEYKSKEARESARYIMKYLCENEGKFSYYKENEIKCSNLNF